MVVSKDLLLALWVAQISYCAAKTPRAPYPTQRSVFCPLKSTLHAASVIPGKQTARVTFRNAMQEAAELYWLDENGKEWFTPPLIAPVAGLKVKTFMGARFLIKRSSDQRVVLDHTVGPQEIQLPPDIVCDASQNSGKARPPNYGTLLPTQTVLGLANLSPCDLVVNWKTEEAFRTEFGEERWSADLPAGQNPHFEYTWIGHEFIVRVRSDNTLVKAVKVADVEILPCTRETEKVKVTEAAKQAEQLQSRQQNAQNEKLQTLLKGKVLGVSQSTWSVPVMTAQTNLTVPVMPTMSMNHSWGFTNKSLGAIAIPDPMAILTMVSNSIS